MDPFSHKRGSFEAFFLFKNSPKSRATQHVNQQLWRIVLDLAYLPRGSHYRSPS